MRLHHGWHAGSPGGLTVRDFETAVNGNYIGVGTGCRIWGTHVIVAWSVQFIVDFVAFCGHLFVTALVHMYLL